MRRRWIQPSTASLRRAAGGSSHLRPPLMRPRRIRPSRAPLDLPVQDQATDLVHPSPRLTSFPPCRTSPATNRRPRASTSPPGYSACRRCPNRSRQLGGVGVSALPDDEFPPVSWTPSFLFYLPSSWEQCGVCLCSAVPPRREVQHACWRGSLHCYLFTCGDQSVLMQFIEGEPSRSPACVVQCGAHVHAVRWRCRCKKCGELLAVILVVGSSMMLEWMDYGSRLAMAPVAQGEGALFAAH